MLVFKKSCCKKPRSFRSKKEYAFLNTGDNRKPVKKVTEVGAEHARRERRKEDEEN